MSSFSDSAPGASAVQTAELLSFDPNSEVSMFDELGIRLAAWLVGMKSVPSPPKLVTPPKLFISYRREDSAALAGRLFDRLRSHFGQGAVFMDVYSIPFGVDFRKEIEASVSKCDVLLAVIGDRWTTMSHNGKIRLSDPNDFVRIEIEAALRKDIPVIPVLAGSTPMPPEDELPGSLTSLVYRHACRIDLGPDFDIHVARLIESLEQPNQIKATQGS
jgi:hypothetical protein